MHAIEFLSMLNYLPPYPAHWVLAQLTGACNAKMSPPPTAVRPDRKWQPKLVRPANFGPLGALKLRTWVSHMADLLEPVVDCDSVKDVALLKDALKYIQTQHYPAGI